MAQETEGANKELKGLHATAACLMDADSGRVLFEKNGREPLAMASTTKIMTCIVTLEETDLETLVPVSSNAARQPDVQLGIKTGEYYVLGDLLYSLMLESHNDVAVAIAECVGGSVEKFAALMNKKANEIGCDNTYFITPNGLDAKDEVGVHSTSATDLAKIMSYCIKRSPKAEDFLHITRTKDYSFCNRVRSKDGVVSRGSRSFSCHNHNAFLQMMEGALSGKTGFTGNAGYCYVGALESEGRTFVVSLLGCGWPNHKTYKWEDTRRLMQYAKEHFQYVALSSVPINSNFLSPLLVQEGQTEHIGESARVEVFLSSDSQEMDRNVLLGDEENIRVCYKKEKMLKAPVRSGEKVGTLTYMVGDTVILQNNLLTKQESKKIDISWCIQKIAALYFWEG